jgi:hypothetical protein
VCILLREPPLLLQRCSAVMEALLELAFVEHTWSQLHSLQVVLMVIFIHL